MGNISVGYIQVACGGFYLKVTSYLETLMPLAISYILLCAVIFLSDLFTFFAHYSYTLGLDLCLNASDAMS